MKLNNFERVVLAELLAKYSGNFETLKLVREFREYLSFTEDEIATGNIRREGDLIRWDNDLIVEFSIPSLLAAKITTDLQKMNEQALLTDKYFSLYEKFVVNTFGG